MTRIFDKGNNAFDALRLIAAVVVIYSHSYAIAPTPGASELISRLTNGATHAGELSVVIFFFLSGALITKSLIETKDVKSFFVKRILRIYPALVFCAFTSAYIFSWTFGGSTFSQILSSNDAFLYFVKNSIGIWNLHEISGVYALHPSKGLNGSLWSITLEIRLYLIVGLLYLSGFLKSKLSIIIIFLVIISATAIVPEAVPLVGSEELSFGNYSFPVFTCIFLIGGLFYILEKHFEINIYTVCVVFLFLVLCNGSQSTKFLVFLFTIVFCIWLATRISVVNVLRLKQDYSYGVYLYGWPSQQIAYSLISPSSTPQHWQITIIAIPLAFFLAYFSWKFLEKPSIIFSRRIFNK